MVRRHPPKLPEMSQPAVLRHYDHLSQENLGVDFNIDVGQGTCTMKYSPKVNDQLARSHKLTDLHPLQPVSTVQGILEVMYRLEGMLKEISGMDRVTLQPGAGSAAIYANVAMIRAYHESRGEGAKRTEVITSSFSHPSNGAAAKVAGYKIITLPPDADGYPDFEALKAAVSEHTAALLITNPEDTGIFNPRIVEFVNLVHAAGGLSLQPSQDFFHASRLRRSCCWRVRSDKGDRAIPAVPNCRIRWDFILPRLQPPAKRWQDSPVVWRDCKYPQGLRMDHEPRCGWFARGV
jgi:glycine dehydrogenase subunit 2